MHDLINDLAVYVAGERCFGLEDDWESSDDAERVLHSSYITQRVLVNLLPKLKCLRLLSLRGNNIMELPSSVGDLKHLRYIDLSWTSIKTLPESVTTLYNLQTLSLSGCRYLSKLPVGMGNLISLRHLDNADTRDLREMPHGIGKLTNLQTLSKFVVGKGNALGLSELRVMKLLHGKLSITELQNVSHIRDAQEAKFGEKCDLYELVLEWSTKFDDSDANFNVDVLGVLQPQKNLQKLTIYYYGGGKLPDWIGNSSFEKLLEINLIGFKRCTSLPSLGNLCSLKVLSIQDIPEIKSIGIDFSMNENTQEVSFLSLEKLTFDDMPKWEEWCVLDGISMEVSPQFPCLRELTLQRCPKLIRIPRLQLPSLCILKLESCHAQVLKGLDNLTSLANLTCDSVAELDCLSEEFMQFCGALEYLEIKMCNELVHVWGEGVSLAALSCLKEMKVKSCHRLMSFTDIEQALPCNLELLSIDHCDSLTNIPDGPSLINLSIRKCKSLRSFAAGMLPVLQRLDIKECKALDSVPDYEAGVFCLEDLKVSNCPSLRWWPLEKAPTTLKKLCVSKNCMNLKIGMELQRMNHKMQSLLELDIRNSWGVLGRIVKSQQHKLGSLVKLVISNCKDFESFRESGWPQIPKLKVLFVGSCKNLRYFPLDQIQSLASLNIWYCPKLEFFQMENYPQN